MNWFLLLFVLLAAIVMAIADIVKNKDTNWKDVLSARVWYYVLSVLVCGALAYFIKETVIQGLLLVVLVVVFARIFRGIISISE